MLQQEQCDSGQGFLYARPLDAAAAETFLKTWPNSAGAALAHGAQRNATTPAPHNVAEVDHHPPIVCAIGVRRNWY